MNIKEKFVVLQAKYPGELVQRLIRKNTSPSGAILMTDEGWWYAVHFFKPYRRYYDPIDQYVRKEINVFWTEHKATMEAV